MNGGGLSKIRVFGASLFGAAILFVGGIVFWGAFNTAMEATNTMPFCISCHEMEQFVYQDYTKTVHFQNRSGVKATCSDCHVPDPWVHKIVRKIQASQEVFHKVMGSVATPEKFEAKRLTLAKRVWKTMKDSDSRECRNCHSWAAMADEKQKKRSWKSHQDAQKDGMTCIDCHKGIAHRPVHDLLADGENYYDGKPDPRRHEVRAVAAAAPAAAPAAPAAPAAEPAAAPVAAPAAAPAAAAAGMPAIDWAAVPAKDVVLLYPGQTSFEWIQQGSDHGGARAFKAGDKCSDCHAGEQADMGKKMTTGEKAEPTPIPGKPGHIPLTVKAAFDAENLYMQFQWPAAQHAPAPFAEGGKMDPANEVKLALMLDAGKVEDADRTGCWATCHHDARSMPDAPDAAAIAAAGDVAKALKLEHGVTKYLPATRSEIEIRGGEGKPRGGWNKLLPQADLDKMLADGVFLDFIRFKSGEGGVTENGYILAERVATAADGITFSGGQEGGVWTVVLQRKLNTGTTGDVVLEPGNTYTMGFAIHDDFSTARFHHVSIDYRLGLGVQGAEIEAVKLP